MAKTKITSSINNALRIRHVFNCEYEKKRIQGQGNILQPLPWVRTVEMCYAKPNLVLPN